MLQVEAIENTNRGRFRKLVLSFGSVGGMLYVQYNAGLPMNWPCSVGCALVVIAFTNSDVLEKAMELGLEKLKGKLPGAK